MDNYERGCTIRNDRGTLQETEMRPNRKCTSRSTINRAQYNVYVGGTCGDKGDSMGYRHALLIENGSVALWCVWHQEEAYPPHQSRILSLTILGFSF